MTRQPPRSTRTDTLLPYTTPLRSQMTGSLHASSYAPPGIARRVEQGRGRVAAMKSLRCAGAEYLRLAAGETHFSLFTRLMPWDHVPGRSEEHTSELQSLMRISYAVFCLKKKNIRVVHSNTNLTQFINSSFSYHIF